MVATAARLHQLPACGEASRSYFTVPPRLGKGFSNGTQGVFYA